MPQEQEAGSLGEETQPGVGSLGKERDSGAKPRTGQTGVCHAAPGLPSCVPSGRLPNPSGCGSRKLHICARIKTGSLRVCLGAG